MKSNCISIFRSTSRWLCIALVWLFAGCEDEKNGVESEGDRFSVSPSKIQISSDAKTPRLVAVDTNVEWNVTDDRDWIYLERGATSFFVTVDEYSGSEPRTGSITVTASGFQAVTIEVEQLAPGVNQLHASAVTSLVWEFYEEGVMKGISVFTSADSWDFDGSAIDLKFVDSQGNDVILFEIEKTEYELRITLINQNEDLEASVGEITITAPNAEPVTLTVRVGPRTPTSEISIGMFEQASVQRGPGAGTGLPGNEVFFRGELILLEGSEVKLVGELASDDVVVHLDYFERVNTETIRFVGQTGVYQAHYSPSRRMLLLHFPEPYYPNHLIALCSNFTYPSKAAVPAHFMTGFQNPVPAHISHIARYPENINSGHFLDYVVFRRIEENVYQTTVMLRSRRPLKVFHARGPGFANNVVNAWGTSGDYKWGSVNFSGAMVFPAQSNATDQDWITGCINEALLYRITLTITSPAPNGTADVHVQVIDFDGNEINEGDYHCIDRDPLIADPGYAFDLITQSSHGYDRDEAFRTIHLTLEQNKEYTLEGVLADNEIVYNVDFFERTAVDKVKFLGRNGNYRLQYNPVRKNMLVIPALANNQMGQVNGLMMFMGTGLYHPTKVSLANLQAVYSGRTLERSEWNNGNFMQYLLMREIETGKYQGTVVINGNISFKPYTRLDWQGEMQFPTINEWIGEDIIQSNNNNDWHPKTELKRGQPYRFVIDFPARTVEITEFVLP